MTADADDNMGPMGDVPARGYLVSRKEAIMLASGALLLVVILMAAVTGLVVVLGVAVSGFALEWLWPMSIWLAWVAGGAIVGWMTPDRPWSKSLGLTAGAMAASWAVTGAILLPVALIISEPCSGWSFFCIPFWRIFVFFWIMWLPPAMPIGLMLSLAARRARRNIEAGRPPLELFRRQPP